jgi:hypothetical protein
MGLMEVTHRPDFLKHDVSETRLCLRFKVKLNLLDPTDRASPCVGFTLRRRQNAASETSCFKNVRTMNNVLKSH